jgi:hypothetical protein
MAGSIDRQGRKAGEALRAIVRDLLSRKPGGHLIESSLSELDLHLRLELDDEQGSSDRLARALIDSLDRQLDDAIQQAAVFRPGHAYCHRCRSATCDHSLPPSGRHVFAGYQPTGMPRWVEFGQLCLDNRHPDVDRLYARPPALLTRVHGRGELHGGILDAFKNRGYELLGQVTAGFYSVAAPAQPGREVLALTIQAAASRNRRGAIRLGLNHIGRATSGDAQAMLGERERELPWRKAMLWAQSALSTLPRNRRRGRSAEEQHEERVAGILRGLARRLESDRRARARRTAHAQERHTTGERPTRKALDDARVVGYEGLLVDERSGALVVLGDRGRTHFFSPEGRLVTSVRYSKEAIAGKIQAQLWKRASRKVHRNFVERLVSATD